MSGRVDCPHDGRHEHGTPGAYRRDKCRCAPCRQANSAYLSKRRKLIAYGRWEFSWVDAQPARDHVNALREAGMGIPTIAAAAGLAMSTLDGIMGWRRAGEQTQEIRPETERRILAVRPTLDLIAAGAQIDGTGMRRRLQALHALGWTARALSEHLGVTPHTVTQTMRATGKVTAGNARRIAALYDELWDKLPPTPTKSLAYGAQIARETAARNGWPPPLAWDDETIDDPKAKPVDVTRKDSKRGRPLAETIEEIEEILAQSPLATAQQIADRMNLTRSAIQNSVKRAKREDLMAILARNAELAA